MAFKIVNNILLHNDSSVVVDELKLGDINDQPTISDAVLIHDGLGNVTLQNVTIPQVDSEFITTIAQLEAYADQAEADAIATSSINSTSYTNAREIAITASYEAYADQAEADANAYTDSQVSAGTGSLTTDDIAEASNLYYTDSRVANYISTNSITLGTETIGNYVATISGTTNEVEVTGSGTETASVTIGLPENVTVSNNLTVEGDLTVNGTTTTVLSQNTRINENLLYLNEGGESTITNAVGNGTQVTYTADNDYSVGYTVDITGVTPSSFNGIDIEVIASDSTSFTIASTNTDTYVSGGEAYGHAHVNVDLGWAGAYDDGTYAHAGVFRDATDGVFKVFEGYTPEPSAAVDINTAHASFSLADFEANNVIINGTPTASNHATTKAYVDNAVSTGTGALDTDSIPEGATNLYYTNARVDARIPTNVSEFTNDSNYSTFISNQATDTTSTVTFDKVRISSTTDASAISTAHGLQVGTTAGQNIIVDTNEVMARDNGAVSSLHLNADGGDVTINNNLTDKVTFSGGEITASGDITAYSDRALKRNIQTLENGLDKVMNMRGVTFLKDGKASLGVIAQEVETVIPEVVKQDQHGMRSVAYGNIVGVLIEAIKEQQAQIEELKSKLNEK